MKHSFENGTLHLGDCMQVIKQQPDNSVDCVITSPPYWQLRDYGFEGNGDLNLHTKSI